MGEETVPSVAPGRVPLAVRTVLDVGCYVGVHPGLQEVPSHKLDRFLLSEVSGHFAIVFGFENCGDHLLGNIETSSVVQYVVRLQCQMLGWFDIIGAMWVSAEGTQT